MTAFPADAGQLTFDGPFVQGGLVVGQAAPGALVRLDDHPVRVGDDGRFVLGFGRDAGAEYRLLVTWPDGASKSSRLHIKARDYDIQRIDGLPQRKVTPKPEDIARIKDDNAQIAAVRKLDTDAPFFASGFIWPAKGRISGVYGSQRILNGVPRRPHNGVDIAAPVGTPVVAAAGGVVALVHPDMFYSGKTVMIDHGHGLSTVYVHMSDILVEPGARVERGQLIGKVGMSGRATGPHLHWGLSWFSTHLDPALAAGEMTQAE
ncbi:MAG: M23 family metallopeptidase [Rhodospirillales bacterium]|nr:M23 family metallopeptidase [Rhodospirillales bacterium]